MMLTPTIRLGLNTLIRGPICANSKIKVTTEDEELEEFLQDAFTRFKIIAMESVMEHLEFGYSCHEFIYDEEDGELKLFDVNRFKPFDCEVYQKNNKYVGFKVNPIDLYVPKETGFHLVYQPKHNKHYGRSILFTPFTPWIEQWAVGGMEDIKKLWFAKNAYNSGILYYPTGVTTVNGIERSNDEIAQDIAQKMATGHVITVRLKKGEGGNVTATGVQAPQSEWVFLPAQSNPVPEGMLDSRNETKMEQLEAMGILREVVESSGGGFGAVTGRTIPVDLYMFGLQVMFNWVLWNMQKQYFPIVLGAKYAGKKIPKFKIEPKMISGEDALELEDLESEEDLEAKENEVHRKVQKDPKVTQKRDEAQQKGLSKKVA